MHHGPTKPWSKSNSPSLQENQGDPHSRSEVDTGQRPGVTTRMAEENKALREEIAELRRANEILKAAAIFFGAELDRPGETVIAFIAEHNAELVEPVALGDQPVPVVVADFVTEVSQQGPVRLIH